MSEVTLLSGFDPSVAPRIGRTIDRLIPRLDIDRTAFVGGIAIRYHVAAAGLEYPTTAFGDLDIDGAVNPSVAQDFWIGHHHAGGYLGIVDRRTLVKVDAFPYSDRGRATMDAPYRAGGSTLPIRTVESQLAKTVTDTRKPVRGVAVSPRQFEDAQLLFRLKPDLDTASRMLGQWEEGVEDIERAYDEACRAAKAHPEFMASAPQPRPLSCQNCIHDPRYPLTPLPLVYGAIAAGIFRTRVEQLLSR